MALAYPVECYADEWKRTDPDFVVYLPLAQVCDTSDNVHFQVAVMPKGDLIGIWTQAMYEAATNSRVVVARSSDGGQSWSAPSGIDGPLLEGQVTVYGIPVVSDTGRIYCFYGWHREASLIKGVRNRASHLMCRVSDDDGHTWSLGSEIAFRRSRFDDPDPSGRPWWVIWQKPIRDSSGRWLVSFTRDTHFDARLNHDLGETRCEFIRFDNLNDGPDPEDVELTFLPEDEDGLVVPHPVDPGVSSCWEASVVLLPDDRLFATMTTRTGSLWYAVSADDGATWGAPQPLRYQDVGERVLHAPGPGPLYALQDGRYLLQYNNNDGSMSPGERPRPNMLNRRAAFLAVGEYRSDAVQPIWFSRPKRFADTDAVPAGPEQRCECCTYGSVTEHEGLRVLWYPDRKHFLLGKRITDEWLSDLVAPV